MLLFMVMPALFGGFGNLIINTLYLTNYINYNNITNSLIQNNTKNTITTFNNDNNNQQHLTTIIIINNIHNLVLI